ncbi:uncharacterized protein NPIL_644851 [Nephila pilipes]|uniref:Uncharacterized protein n=1 Tax=Nephila pilipes TaxID=299642 RepID=A0A8X6TFU6_NEPPI|nr:uncharacterized protein NPIL_644851 [Nephila pilipes]
MKVAVLVYSDPDIRVLGSGFVSAENWNPVVEEKLSNLGLPLIIKKRIPPLLKLLSYEVFQWKLDHIPILENRSREPSIEYVWKDNGTINSFQTAKMYIQSENNSLSSRFLMACAYWLEEEANDLWRKLPENDKSNLSSISVIDPPQNRWKLAVKDWIELIKLGTTDWRQHSFSRPLSWYCRDSLVIQGNLLQQLSPHDQLGVFKGMMKDSISTYVRSSYLSIMSAEQFEEVLKTEPLPVFIALCNWPYHIQFPERTERIFSLLSEKEFLHLLLEVICEKIGRDWKDCDYVELLNGLWKRCPFSFKQYVENSEFSDILNKALKHDCDKPFREQLSLIVGSKLDVYKEPSYSEIGASVVGILFR